MRLLLCDPSEYSPRSPSTEKRVPAHLYLRTGIVEAADDGVRAGVIAAESMAGLARDEG